MSIRGTRCATPASTPARIRSSRIRRARDGAVSPGSSRRAGVTSEATTEDVSRVRCDRSVRTAASWSIPLTPTRGLRSISQPPPRCGGWVRGICGGWSCHVEQGRYGHVAKKATWLYAFGVSELPSLRWGHVADQKSTALVSWCGNHVKSNETRPRVGKAAAAATPIVFRDVLISIARSARERGAA